MEATYDIALGTMHPSSSATTTPSWARVPVLIGLFAMAVYLLMGAHSAIDRPSGAKETGDFFGLGRWKMFTDLRPHHMELRAEGSMNGAWQTISLQTLFPSSWHEGPGYHRASFWRDPERLTALARAACDRTGMAEVRLSVVRWDKTLNSVSQPEHNPSTRGLLELPCPP